ncbi:MAG TPA: hypothetical protein VLZ83_11015 [Edaphocola sp.]|nr:hypothetical protein [Edaphocola sp.]
MFRSYGAMADSNMGSTNVSLLQSWADSDLGSTYVSLLRSWT